MRKDCLEKCHIGKSIGPELFPPPLSLFLVICIMFILQQIVLFPLCTSVNSGCDVETQEQQTSYANFTDRRNQEPMHHPPLLVLTDYTWHYFSHSWDQTPDRSNVRMERNAPSVGGCLVERKSRQQEPIMAGHTAQSQSGFIRSGCQRSASLFRFTQLGT